MKLRWGIVATVLYILENVNGYTPEALRDQVTSLPRSTPLLSNQFSGFLNITSTKNIHYMYYESENDPATDPVVFWTNGGPGCSGLLGLYTEFGPWRPMADGTLVSNPWSWTKVANLIFLEQPAGVGFSYGTDPDELSAYNDYRASIDNLLTIRTFFSRFPERAKQPLYVASESYGGHYIPQWTLQLFTDTKLRETFKGMLVGNAYTSYSALLATANVLWGLQMVPQVIWDEYETEGCASLDNSLLRLMTEIPQCVEMLDIVYGYAFAVNPYALDFPICSADFNLNYTFNFDDDYTMPNFGGDDATTSGSNTGNKRRMSSGRSSSGAGSDRWTAGLSPQAKSLLKVHQRVRDSSLYQSSIKKYRAEHPEKVERMNHLSSLLSTDGSSTIESASTRRTPVAPRSQKKNRRLSRDALTYSNDLMNPPNPYNVTYDPCASDYATTYLNDPLVQEALHVLRPSSTDPSSLVGIYWTHCNDYINEIWSFSDFTSDTTDLYNTMFNHEDKPEGFKMLVFSGDSDGVCATIGTQNWIYNITGSEVVSLYKPWYYNDSVYSTQQGGYLTQFSGLLSFATVHHAGHEVPGYQPESSLRMFEMYLDGSIFYTVPLSTSYDGSSDKRVFPDVLSEVVGIILLIVGGVGLIFGATQYWKSLGKKKPLSEESNDL